MRGRRPKPTKAKVLKGTFRKGRSHPREPKPRTGHLRHPDWLKGTALWAWKQIVAELGPEAMDVIGRGDRHVIAMVCDAYREYRQARAQVERDGLMLSVAAVVAPRGRRKKAEPKVGFLADGSQADDAKAARETDSTFLVAARRHPLIGVYQDAWRRVVRGLIELGMTPAARSRVGTIGDKEPQDNAFEQF